MRECVPLRMLTRTPSHETLKQIIHGVPKTHTPHSLPLYPYQGPIPKIIVMIIILLYLRFEFLFNLI